MAENNNIEPHKQTPVRKDKHARKPPRLLIISLSLVIVALTVVVVVLLNREKPAEIVDTGGRGIVATPENIDELKAQVAEPVPDGYFTTRMNIEWVFETSQIPSQNAMVGNPTENTRTVYFDLILKDTEQLVYSSPYIPVGSELTAFALDAELAAGVYPAVVVYHLVDDDYNELTTLSVSVTLHINS